MKKLVSLIILFCIFFNLLTTVVKADTTGTNASDQVEVCIETDADGNCIKPAGDSWLQDVFGESLTLDIFRSSNYWEGETGVFVLLAVLLGNGFIVLFIATIGAIGIGVFKLISSAGDQAKLDNAKKWVTNAVKGFAVVLIAFIGVNIVTYILGVGNVFKLAENLRVCDNTALIEWKRENDKLDWINCKCESGSWTCESPS